METESGGEIERLKCFSFCSFAIGKRPDFRVRFNLFNYQIFAG